MSASELLRFKFDTNLLNITILEYANFLRPRKRCWILHCVENSFILKDICVDNSNVLWKLQFCFSKLQLQSNSGLVLIFYKPVAVSAKLFFEFYSRSEMVDK